jgi:hypothetical protein
VLAAAENLGHDRERDACSLIWLGVDGQPGPFAF